MTETKNVNLELSLDLWIMLRKKALDKKKDFHNYLREILRKEAKR